MKFNSVIFSPDFYSEMDEYYKLHIIQRKNICSAFGIKISVNKCLPPSSAVFVDSDGNVVGILIDGKLVEIPQDSAVNYLAKYPFIIKKKPLEDRGDDSLDL